MADNEAANAALLESEQLLTIQVEGNEEELPRSIPFTKFFTYSTWFDKLLLATGTFAAVAAGAILPSISLVMGNVAHAFSTDTTPGQSTDLLETMSKIAAIVMMIAMGLFVFSYIFYAFWQHLAENIMLDLRKRYIQALMRQEIAYFEVNKVEQIPAQINEIFDTCKGSIGEKIANLIFACSTCFFGIVYAMVYGPVYAAVCIAYLPVLITILAVFGRMVQKSTLRKLQVVKQLGGVAEETLTAIKVVASFTREDRELQKFTRHSLETQEVAKKASSTMALMIGLMKFSIFFFYAYTLYVGSYFIENQVSDYNGRTYDQQIVIQTIIALITGFIGLISALPNVQAIVASTTLGVLIFDVIEREPEIINGPAPIQTFKLDKSITFKNVTFKYPTSLPEHRPVLIDATFALRAGQTTAIVGPSGSGKSTIVQLVERFYDPRPGGTVNFDDCDIRTIDLKVLRQQIGYVSQEPIMIMGTIRDNLLYGNCEATESDMTEALHQANAQFVLEQENGLDTFVGTAGIMNMSGGQKQRIAIARALIRKPKILILDEATSALDPKSEIEVQEAIDAISKSGLNLTILIIAHRLTTIASADNLLYFQSRSNLVSAAKGTPEYTEIFEKLKSIQYACGDTGDDSSSDVEDSDGLKEIDHKQMQNSRLREETEFARHSIANINMDYFSQPNIQTPKDALEAVLESEPSETNYMSLNRVADDDQEITKEEPETFFIPPWSQPDGPVIVRREIEDDVREFESKITSNYTQSLARLRVDTEDYDKKEIEQLIQQRRAASKKQSFRTQSNTTVGSVGIEFDLEFNPLEQQEEERYREIKFREIMAYQNPKYHAILGVIASIFASLNLPLFGYVLSQFIFALNIDPVTNRTEFIHERNVWTIVFVVLCFCIGLSSGSQKFFFGVGGENLTQALRVKLFEALLRKNIGWYDNKYRAPGILTNIIAEDISAVNGLTTETAGIVAEAALGLFFSCLICFIFSWQLALVVSAFSPFMVLGGLGMSKLQFNQQAVDESYKQANALLSDIIINYRTVISFGDKNMQFILDRYNDLLVIPHSAGIKRAHISGLFFAYSQAIRFAFVAFIFYVAAVFVNRYDLNSHRVFTGCYVVFVGAIGSGVSISQMPSVSKAKAAARTVFGIIEEPSSIDPKQTGSMKIASGTIEFKNVYFRYPSRNRYVLRNFNLKILPNQSVAIVGHSGSGKSTIASLLLRFYDAQRGALLIDGVDITDFDLECYRNFVSIVQQEPLLFNETIKSNILFGDLTADDTRVREVATQANALGFIMQNDEDFDSPAIQSRVREQYLLVSREQLNPSEHIKLLTLVNQVLQKSIGYKELMLVNQLLPYMSNTGLGSIERKFDDFLAALKSQAIKQDCTWQQVLRSFVFQSEAHQIEEFFKELKHDATRNTYAPSEQDEDMKKEILDAIFRNPCEFDLSVVKSYREALVDGKNVRFSAFLKPERQRVEEVFQAVYNSSINQLRVKQLERQLDPGFLKMCGLKGGKLSGGQKQRVAIARALIKNPRFMILDEATSALDEQSQEIVQQALDRAMEGRTSVVIAHRMSTIKKCNRIIVLHKGRVVEDGTYEELSNKPNGHFAKLEKGVQ